MGNSQLPTSNTVKARVTTESRGDTHLRRTESLRVGSWKLGLFMAFAVSGCAGISGTRDTAGLKAVATVDQVMDAIVIPSSQALFDAVVYENGELVQSPKNDDDWFRLQMHALAVAEAGTCC